MIRGECYDFEGIGASLYVVLFLELIENFF